MTRPLACCLAALCASAAIANAQLKHTSVPLADTLTKALSESSLTEPGAQPFHLRITVSEPENAQSPYQGSIEEWWSSPQKWRLEIVSKDGVRQVIVVNGTKTEQDTGDYLPLWLRNFATAALDPVPNAAAWSIPGNMIEQITMPNGAKSNACVKAKSAIGTGQNTTDAFSNLCFDERGRLGFYGSPEYSMQFHDYHSFGKKQVPRTLQSNPEPGTALLGDVTVEDLSRVPNSDALFKPLDTTDDRFHSFAVSSATMDKLTAAAPPILWPRIRSGNIHGHLAMYVSVDTSGNVREAWPLNSDNAGLEDPARDQVRQWKLKPATDKSGNRVQVDGPLALSFTTTIGDPLPELNDAETRALATVIVEPTWTRDTLKSGQQIDVQVSVNEAGKLAGTGYAGVPPAAVGPINEAVRQWTFKPLLRDGKPQYFHGTIHFVVP